MRFRLFGGQSRCETAPPGLEDLQWENELSCLRQEAIRARLEASQHLEQARSRRRCLEVRCQKQSAWALRRLKTDRKPSKNHQKLMEKLMETA